MLNSRSITDTSRLAGTDAVTTWLRASKSSGSATMPLCRLPSLKTGAVTTVTQRLASGEKRASPTWNLPLRRLCWNQGTAATWCWPGASGCKVQTGFPCRSRVPMVPYSGCRRMKSFTSGSQLAGSMARTSGCAAKIDNIASLARKLASSRPAALSTASLTLSRATARASSRSLIRCQTSNSSIGTVTTSTSSASCWRIGRRPMSSPAERWREVGEDMQWPVREAPVQGNRTREPTARRNDGDTPDPCCLRPIGGLATGPR